MLFQPPLEHYLLDFVADLRCDGHLDLGEASQGLAKLCQSSGVFMVCSPNDSRSLCCLQTLLIAPRSHAIDNVSEFGKALARGLAAAQQSGGHYCFACVTITTSIFSLRHQFQGIPTSSLFLPVYARKLRELVTPGCWHSPELSSLTPRINAQRIPSKSAEPAWVPGKPEHKRTADELPSTN